ncbi:hypothetical protein [Chromobacterium vaccinii]|uniref:hypothetical protein n=1 Tax=Chromobacterium vaccinii TaxID=1108595 RepID=UPI0011871741|nr:hypothetical protein [Chromobacterium vaccinii]
MSRYHIEIERNSAGDFVGWSIHNARDLLPSHIYPLYEMAEYKARLLAQENNWSEEPAPEYAPIAEALLRNKHE